MTRVLGWLAALGLLAGVAAGFGYAPREAIQGNVQRIMYLHVPSVLTAYLAFGLVLSIALTAVASKAIAGLLDRYRILGYIGVAIIVYVGIEMVYDGGFQVLAATGLDETLHIHH